MPKKKLSSFTPRIKSSLWSEKVRIKLARSLRKDPSITQKNDASGIGNKRGKARRAKTNSNKRDRQCLRKDLIERFMDF